MKRNEGGEVKHMRGADWFIVGVRLIGVWFLAQSIVYVITFFDVFLDITPLQAGVRTPFTYLFYAFGETIMAVGLMVGAPRLANALFGPIQPDRPRFLDDGDEDFPPSIKREDESRR
jgi:hypothetical protein